MVEENLEPMVFDLRRQVSLAGRCIKNVILTNNSFGVRKEAIKVVDGLLHI